MVTIIDEWWLRVLFGLIGSSIISYAAYRLRSLSLSGMIAAMIMGTSFIVFGTPVWFILLIVFFISSSLWSKWKKSSKRKQKTESLYEKSGRRDAAQVWANGGIGLLICLIYAVSSQEILIYMYIGVMAAVTADTWATEIGSISKQKPRSILTFETVEAGRSGGITLLGLVASFCGGLLIGLIGYVLDDTLIHGIWIGSISGLIGSLIDSYMGARWQAMYQCTSCNSLTERKHHCHQQTKTIQGLAWLNNDRVNLISSIGAGLIAVLLYYIV